MNQILINLVLVLFFFLPYLNLASCSQNSVYTLPSELSDFDIESNLHNLSTLVEVIQYFPEYNIKDPPKIYTYYTEPSSKFIENQVKHYGNSHHSNFNNFYFHQNNHHQDHFSHQYSSLPQPPPSSAHRKFFSHSTPNYKKKLYFDDEKSYSDKNYYELNKKKSNQQLFEPPIDMELIREVLSFVLNHLNVIQKNSVNVKDLRFKPWIYQAIENASSIYEKSFDQTQSLLKSYLLTQSSPKPYLNTQLPQNSYSSLSQSTQNHYPLAKTYQESYSNTLSLMKPLKLAQPLSNTYESDSNFFLSQNLNQNSLFSKNFAQKYPLTAHTQHIPGVGTVAIPLPPNVIKLNLPKRQKSY